MSSSGLGWRGGEDNRAHSSACMSLVNFLAGGGEGGSPLTVCAYSNHLYVCVRICSRIPAQLRFNSTPAVQPSLSYFGVCASNFSFSVV
jgi:hypothetical protein